jgi:hypothetical protein
MILRIMVIALGAFPVAIAAVSVRGFSWQGYVFYVGAQAFATFLFLLVNDKIPPLTYAICVGGFVSFFCTVVVWFRGIPPNWGSIVGAILIFCGTLVTFAK